MHRVFSVKTLSNPGLIQLVSTSSNLVGNTSSPMPRQLHSSPSKPSCSSLRRSRYASFLSRVHLEGNFGKLTSVIRRKQVDKIGMGAGHLPMVHPFSMSLNEISTSTSFSPGSIQPADRPPVSRKDLLDAISDQDVFDKLYIDLSHKTIQAYQTSGRKRCAIKLHAGLAGLEQFSLLMVFSR